MEATAIPAAGELIAHGGTSGGSGVALLPGRERPDGPVTTRRLRRTLAFYGAIWSLGVALVLIGSSVDLTGLGLGLIAPGGGLLYHGHWLLALLTLGLFAVALVLWLGSGNVIAPVAVWLTPAVVELLHTPTDPWNATEWAVPAAGAGLVVAALVIREVSFRSALARVDTRNAYLRELPVPRARASAPASPAPELSADELAFARFTLDRALQPVAEFEGFDRLEQFQTSSVRYQVNVAGYALATLQYARTPSFHGYLSQAQRNLIAKTQERICWSYWSKESLWGHLRYNPDPIPRDNIMVSGWLGYQLAGYVSNTLDDRYSEPGSITFAHPSGRRYEYDFHSIVATLARNFEASDFCLFPCEPNWIYALCNGFGILPLPVHDRLYGTDYWDRVGPAFKRRFEDEFLTVDGRTIGIRSSLTGLTVPAMTSILSDCSVIWQLAPVYPDLAARAWEIVRHEWLALADDGGIEAKLSGWDRIDTGNYRRSPISAYLWIAAAATELGDAEVATRMRAEIERRFEPTIEAGVKRYGAGSVQANLGLLLVEAGAAGIHAARINDGAPDAIARGPILDEAAYPNVLVARAVSDGEALELVLRPGDGGGREGLGIARLSPGRRYNVSGALERELTADAEGNARVRVDLADRLEVEIAPAA